MKTVFYTKIRPAEGQTEVDVIRRAHVLGYELMKFAGWDDADLGASGNHGPCWNMARLNLVRAKQIQDACEIVIDGKPDWPHIIMSAVLPATGGGKENDTKNL